MNEIIAANRDFRGRPGGSYTKLKREIEEYVLWEATLQKFEPIRGAYRVDTTWYVTNSRRDPDNIRAGIKFVLDALVRGGFLGGDSLRWCRSLTDGFSVVKGEDHCSITIQPWLEN